MQDDGNGVGDVVGTRMPEPVRPEPLEEYDGIGFDENLVPEGSIAGILKAGDMLVKFVAKVRERAVSELLQGREIPGVKLTRTQVSRRVHDPDGTLREILINRGLADGLEAVRAVTRLEPVLRRANEDGVLTDKDLKDITDRYIVDVGGKPQAVDEGAPGEPLGPQDFDGGPGEPGVPEDGKGAGDGASE